MGQGTRRNAFGIGGLFSLAIAGSLALGCSADSDDAGDGENDAFGVGKADGGIDPDSNEAKAVLALVNDPEVDVATLDDAAGLAKNAALGIIGRRNGADGTPGTADDNAFDTLAELDAVPFVGPVTLSRLLEFAIANGYLQEGGAGEASIDVIFSPQPSESTHNARAAQIIGEAQHSIDIAMYSFSNAGVKNALAATVERGVKVRMVFETANEDRK